MRTRGNEAITGRTTNVVALLLCVLASLPADSLSFAAEPASPSGSIWETAATSRLRTLGAEHATEFRQAFDEAKAYDRYVVALSPT